MHYMKLSEYPMGTVITLDGDRYEKSLQFWEPQSTILNRVTLRQMDAFQGTRSVIEIVSIPWNIVTQLIVDLQDYKYNIDSTNLISRDDILRYTMTAVAEEEERQRKHKEATELEELAFLLGED